MSKNERKIKVLFLCTANSCRSQMAEGWARHLKGDSIEAYSAGVAPQRVSLRAIAVMKDAGIDISGHYSKHVDELAGIDFDYVVTVCDNAREQCPIFPGKAKMVHVAFEDPAMASGTEREIMTEFRKVRDQIREFVSGLPGELKNDY